MSQRPLSVFALSLSAFLCLAPCLGAQAKDPVNLVAAWLDARAYQGASRSYAEADLQVPAQVAAAAEALGVSRFSLLRNEIYARRGYVFKTPALDSLFRATRWYRPDSMASLATLGVIENGNVTYIKRIEDSYDLEIVRVWASNKEFYGSSYLYLSTYMYAIPPAVESSLKHLGLNPARFLTWEIYARYGWAAPGPMAAILKGVYWFEEKARTMEETLISMDRISRANLELLSYYEWPYLLEAVPYSVPEGVEMIPAFGFGAFFVRRIEKGGATYYFSSHRAWDALVADSGAIGDRHAPVELLPPAIVVAIKEERDPLRKVRLFFEHKRYRGYVDAIKFDSGDMAPPDYVAAAFDDLGIDFRRALRKEIHARNGAKIFDPDLLPVFSACSWFRPQYDLSAATASRFPAGAKITALELSNYALLEGGELHDLYARRKGAAAAVDLQGRLHFIRTFELPGEDGGAVRMGAEYLDYREYEGWAPPSIRDWLLERVEEKVGDLEGLYYEQLQGGAAAC